MERTGEIFSRLGRSRRAGCRGCGTGCFLLLLLLAALLCGVIYLLSPRSAQAMNPAQGNERRPLAVFLLIDNSNSLFEKGGIGSDPDLLRIDAARLFLAYLGVDEPDVTHQAAVIFFGSRAETAVPLTPLTTDDRRAQIFAQIANPPRMGWTDHLAALELAQAQAAALDASHHPIFVLLTDGAPEWANTPTEAEQTAYVAALRTKSAELAKADTPLFIILLANETTDGDPNIAAIWQPLWQEMSATTPPSRFFVARSAADLPGIYHDIVVALTGSQTQGIVMDTAVPASGAAISLTVPPGLDQLTLVISKTDPAQTIHLSVGGLALDETGIIVRRAGGDGRTREEVWVIEQPPPGEWTVHLEGAGSVTIWQDVKPAPTPAATPTPTQPPTTPVELPPARPPEATAVAASPLTPILEPPPVVAPAEIAFAIATGSPVIPAAAASPPARWPWLLGGTACLSLVVGGLFWRYRSRPATVTGALRLLDNAQTTDGRTLIELDTLNQTKLTIGPPPADVPLAGAGVRAVIRPGVSLADAQAGAWADAHEMLISGSGPLHLNGLPVTHETRLADTAVIDFNGVRARYENLRLRRAEREAAFGEQ